jgi:hypothetical protein
VQKDEVTKLREPVVSVRTDVAGAPAAYRAVGDLRYRGDVDLSDAEGFQGVDDLNGFDGPFQRIRHRSSSCTSGLTTGCRRWRQWRRLVRVPRRRPAGRNQTTVLTRNVQSSSNWLRGKYWDEADPNDMLDFEDWRRRSPRNPARVSGAKWNRELPALQRLYRWATAQQLLTVNPMAVKTVRTRHGDMVETSDAWAKDVRSSNVRWLTPRAYRLWRDVGLRGYTAEGRPDRSWRGRHDDRNAAYADLLFSSGLRVG